MHIAFLNPQGNFDPKDSYWAEHPDFGGQLVYVKEVASELAKLGHMVDILTRKIVDPDWPEFAKDLDAYPEISNLRIIRISCGPPHFLPKEELWPYLAKEWVQNILAFYEEQDQAPNIFTSHYGDGGLAGVVLQSKSGTPFTFTGHSLGAQKMEKLGVTAKNFADFETRYHFSARIAAERISMNHASWIITSTKQEKEIQYAHPAYQGAIQISDDRKFSVISPGVNLKIFSREPEDMDSQIATRINQIAINALQPERDTLPFILSASRLDPKKNLTGLVTAFALSQELQQNANIMLAVRGSVDSFSQKEFFSSPDNSVLKEIYSIIEQYNLEGKIIAVPINSQLELASAYRHLKVSRSVFVLTALYEPFGLAPLEALACGLPAVVTKNGGPTESLLEGSREFGVLIDPENSADIADGLLRLLRSEDEWKTFQQAGFSRVHEKYTWHKTAKGYERAFLEIISEKVTIDRSGNLDISQYFMFPDGKNWNSALFDWLET